MTEAKFTSVKLPARQLDHDGRCCGRKPKLYKTRRGMQAVPDPHHFCVRCDAEYALDGTQRSNWAWQATGDGWFAATYPNGRGVMDLLILLEAEGRDNSVVTFDGVLPEAVSADWDRKRAEVADRQRVFESLPEPAHQAYEALRQQWMPLGKVEDLQAVRRALIDAWANA